MNTLVHEEKYRGDALLKKMAEVSIVVCGAGAVGSNLVENMARQGFKKFTVIDFDRVDDHNRHTQAYDRRDVGQVKVSALKSRIFNVMGISIEAVAKKLEPSNVAKLLTGNLIIDGFDNSESRGLVTQHCRDKNIECLHVGLYRDYAEVSWNQNYRVPQPVKGLDVCEYPLARNIITMAIAVATESIINFLDLGERSSYAITLRDMKINLL